MSLTKPDTEGIIRHFIHAAWVSRGEWPLDSGSKLMKLLTPGHPNIAKVAKIRLEMQEETMKRTSKLRPTPEVSHTAGEPLKD